jgi:hypothetical protein
MDVTPFVWILQDQFRFRHTDVYVQLKSEVGNIFTKLQTSIVTSCVLSTSLSLDTPSPDPPSVWMILHPVSYLLFSHHTDLFTSSP